MKVGTPLQQLRVKAGLSQKELAKELGITQSYLSQIENNAKEASTAIVKSIGDYFKVPYAIVLWGAIEESDVAPDKRDAFLQIKPLVDSLINQLN